MGFIPANISEGLLPLDGPCAIDLERPEVAATMLAGNIAIDGNGKTSDHISLIGCAHHAIPDLIRTKINLLPEGIMVVRTVELTGLDLQADGGTHVANTSEVGRIRITDYKSKGKINKRIYLELRD